MEASLSRQRDSVQRQVTNAVAVPVGWFTVPWPNQNAPTVASECPAVPQTQLDTLFERSATENKVSPVLLREVARQESAFSPCAISSKGALGIMQLLPETAADLNVADLFDPAANISAGAKLLASLIERYKGDRRLALAAYNAGPERVSQYAGVPPFPETQNYVEEILRRVTAAEPAPKP
jgi:soluble lytic murein transglycosylase-like protein